MGLNDVNIEKISIDPRKSTLIIADANGLDWLWIEWTETALHLAYLHIKGLEKYLFNFFIICCQ